MPDLTASVIIPTYNRPAQLQVVLEALARQTFPLDCLEVLVVDDGSRESYAPITERKWPFHLRYLRQENQGEVIARGLGIASAASDFLIFLDDDIYAEPGYIAELVAEHQRYPMAIIVGVLYTWPGEQPNLFKQIISLEQPDTHPGPVSYIECGTGTMSVGIDIYKAAGGMRTLGPGGRNAWGGMDFAYRAHLAGYTIRRCATAIAYHDDYALNDLATFCKRYFNVSRMAVLHFQRFPELLPQIRMFSDMTPIRWQADPHRQILRKLLRAAASTKVSQVLLDALLPVLENAAFLPRGLLLKYYRWMIGGYIFRGFREGLRTYGKISS